MTMDVSCNGDITNMIPKNSGMPAVEKEDDSNTKMLNNTCGCQENSNKNSKDYTIDVGNELSSESKYEDQCSCYLKNQYFGGENMYKNMQNFSFLKKSSNSFSDFPLVSCTQVLTGNGCDSSSFNNIDCSDLFLPEKIDCLLHSETVPFHPKIESLLQELVLEMKVLLDSLKSGSNSVTNPVALSYFTRIQIICQYLGKIVSVEFRKLKECKTKKQNFEEYSFCMKSSALKQDKLIQSIVAQVNSCVEKNISLYEQLCVLKDKLQSSGLLKPEVESHTEYQNNSKILNQITDNSKISDDFINFDVQQSNDMPSDYLESLQIFNTSSVNLQTLIIQATNLQSVLNSSYKLNNSLISRFQDQELHMKSITKNLKEAHNLLALMKQQHRKLQSSENIIKYDLQEKRRLLNKLKQQLEATRENCNLVRMKNSKSEVEWQDLRREFVQRNKQISEKSVFIDKSEDISLIDKNEDNSVNDKSEENSFIYDKSVCSINDENENKSFISDNCTAGESCFIDDVYKSEETESVLDNDMFVSINDIDLKYELKKKRLQLLEEQCQTLCTNLKNSSKKRKELDNRLESWCKAIEHSAIEVTKKNNFSEVLSVDETNQATNKDFID